MENENYIGASTEDFVDYFKSNSLEDWKEEMLLLNFYSPGHTITPQTMAAAKEWKNFNAANLHYGALSGKVSEEMGFELPDKRYKVSFFCEFDDIEVKEEWEVGWIMRPELVEAVKQLRFNTEGAKERAEMALSHAELMLL